MYNVIILMVDASAQANAKTKVHLQKKKHTHGKVAEGICDLHNQSKLSFWLLLAFAKLFTIFRYSLFWFNIIIFYMSIIPI